jgi:hypothetical protein
MSELKSERMSFAEARDRNILVDAVMESGGSVEDCVVALVTAHDKMQRHFQRLLNFLPRKVVRTDGSTMVYHCPNHLIPDDIFSDEGTVAPGEAPQMIDMGNGRSYPQGLLLVAALQTRIAALETELKEANAKLEMISTGDLTPAYLAGVRSCDGEIQQLKTRLEKAHDRYETLQWNSKHTEDGLKERSEFWRNAHHELEDKLNDPMISKVKDLEERNKYLEHKLELDTSVNMEFPTRVDMRCEIQRLIDQLNDPGIVRANKEKFMEALVGDCPAREFCSSEISCGTEECMKKLLPVLTG